MQVGLGLGMERIEGLSGKQSVLGLLDRTCMVIALCVGFSLHLMLISLAILLEKSCDQGPRKYNTEHPSAGLE